MSQYSIEEVNSRNQLDSIVDVIWAAMDGVDPSHQIFYPVFGSRSTDRDSAVQSSKDRMWHDHENDPSSHWIFAMDNTSGEILGGCQWRIYTENPFPNGTPHIEAVWWPEGDGRAFATEVVRQCYTPRTKWMAYPHAGLSLMCVYPQHQRHGIGRMLMEWGLTKMDTLGLESFIEATDIGKSLYAKNGYQLVNTVSVVIDRPDPSVEWSELSQKLLPIGFTAMWRPKWGMLREGEPEVTWGKRLMATRS